ncbi:PA2169 family four-helix-bundle protein [Dokdonia sinensis]|uniref:PA2169 family four-helix-bundle protein n=1 Tax=Dokdonia sinensis TaxID=2479847 RepID=A0A3M0G7L4_9FLAO|nr:PA2169 family four-helix-bundle protein [Dokdonia sinensis]RMB57673.1 PA2169 family four-helix-bundle protein [Dokdonia sinensis]
MKTTLEKAREESHENVVNNLQELLEKNYDAEAGYKNAMTHATSAPLTEYFKLRAAQRNRFATQLTDMVIGLNETPKESGSTTASLHRTWMNIKDSVSGDSDEALLEECIRGEKASVEEYDNRLKNNDFTPEITSVLAAQRDEIKNALNQVKTLEDLA